MNDDKLLVPADFNELANWLNTMNSTFSPAELHGALVGGISGSMRLSEREWTAFGLAVMGADERLTAEQRAGAQSVLAGLAQEQLELLISNDMVFTPFLPDDDTDIELCAEAMGLWCKGFLGGFAEAQLYRERHDDQFGHADLPPNVVEVLRDMTAIAQASVAMADSECDDFEDDELFEDLSVTPVLGSDVGLANEQLEDHDNDERDYTEIVEYLRLAALTVFTEYGWVEAYGASPNADQLDDGSDGLSTLGETRPKMLH